VREHILADIRSGRWRAGDRLPTEVELMARFGVSRAPIREAMQSLLLLGIVDISPRRGAVVRVLPIASVVDLAILSASMGAERQIPAVFEFREVMESGIAELYAAHASVEHFETLRAIVAENVAAVSRGDLVEAQRIDVAFHAAIAEGSGNIVFQTVARALAGLLVALRTRTSGIPGAALASLAEHQEIFAALANRDGPTARRASEQHIRNTRVRYEAASGNGRHGETLPVR
jgi:GntR family transcriptional repressor for pyruvate dehydrogenase complex